MKIKGCKKVCMYFLSILVNIAQKLDGHYNNESITDNEQGRIHGNPVADGWAGAIMQKPLGIQKCDGRTDGRTDLPTDRHGKV